MFGYVKPNKNELKTKTVQQYSNIYCALCHALGKNYGLVSQFTINYDITFLYFVLKSEKNNHETIKFRCPFNLLKKVNVSASKKVLNYCAAINYMLTVEKIKDDFNDKNGIVQLFLKMIYKFLSSNKNYKRFITDNPIIYNNCVNKLEKYYDLEKNTDTDFDDILNTFGSFFVSLVNDFEYDSLEDHKEAIKNFAFQLGKWICLIDALDDLEKDIRTKNSNILLFIDPNKSLNELVRTSIIILQMINTKMKRCVQEDDFLKSNELVNNFVTYGCIDVEKQVIFKYSTKKKEET